MFRNNLSIHFPLTREDFTKRIYNQLYDLSIHFPLTREDYSNSDHRIKHCLSIHFPLTREDWSGIGYSGIGRSFNPLPSHEGRLVTLQRGEPPKTFQSTSLSRGKTRTFQFHSIHTQLSIHFPLTREDRLVLRVFCFSCLSIHFPLTREDICRI